MGESTQWRIRAVVSFVGLIVAVAGQSRAAGEVAAVSVPDLGAAAGSSAPTDPSWSKAARLSLDMDFTYRRRAEEPTVVYVGQENGFIDVAFAAEQKAPIVATQETNGSGVLNDDYVGIELNPGGTQGLSYAFYSNARGARFATSSENSAYSPDWKATAVRTAKGYNVTMHIPLHVIRASGSTSWRAQFLRHSVESNGLSVWTYSTNASQVSDPSFFGMLNMVGTATAEKTTQRRARIQPYFLDEWRAPSAGSSTSHLGIDVSVPVTQSDSFVASLHPDYSNVEIDQQTIAPAAFARQYSEVRPFFTQSGSFFGNTYYCLYCPQSLYTPAIPQFSQGYAFEGTHGAFNYAAYDARGSDRTDDAQTVNYIDQNSRRVVQLGVQRVGVATSQFVDTATTLDAGYLNQQTHLGAYVNVGRDAGTFVTDPRSAGYLEAGPIYSGPTTSLAIAYQRVGAQYSPVDGYVAANDVAGYEAFGKHTFNFTAHSALHDISFMTSDVRQWNHAKSLALALNFEQLSIDFRNKLTLRLTANDIATLSSGGEFLPFNANGVTLGYRLNTNTPSYVQYQGGPYYHGRLSAWTYVATLPVTRHLSIAGELDDNTYLTRRAGETSTTQWLERVSIDWQFNHNAQLDIGARRIVGSNLPNAYQPLTVLSTAPCAQNPYYPGCTLTAGNISGAFHFLAEHNEIYIGYGDPNSLVTYPGVFLKWIRYIGAEKGT